MKTTRKNFIRAMSAWEGFSDGKRRMVKKLAADIYGIKKKTEQKAIALNYSQACRASIATCRGECCRLHFPKTFTKAEFLAMIGGMTPAERNGLADQILSGNTKEDQCVLLTPDGCYLCFKHRPMVCTNAYPCFAGREYWEFKEAGNRKVKSMFNQLEALIG